MKDAVDVSLVLACYNEESLFEESVREIIEVLDRTNYTYELIFVDDCSRDRTRELIDRLVEQHPNVRIQKLFHEENKGRGATVTDGFRMAKGRFQGYIDIDLEVHARYVPECVRALEQGFDVATAHRIYTFQLRSIGRYAMSKGYIWLTQRMLRTAVKDSETGFKFFRADRIGTLLDEIEDPGWFWDTEFMIRAEKKGLRIVEIPCLFIRRFDKTSSVQPIRDSVVQLERLLAFRSKLK